MSEMALKMLMYFAATSFVAWILLFTGIGTRRECRRRCEQEYARTTGVIVDYTHKVVRAARHGTRSYWLPVVEFTAEGQSVHREYDNALDPKKFPAGTSVEILYDVNRPERFHLAEDPVFLAPGLGAIRISIIWILASAALTVILAVFVGGARFDLRSLWYDIQRLFRR